MDSVLVDQPRVSSRKATLAGNNVAESGGGFAVHSSLNSYSSLPSFMLPNHHQAFSGRTSAVGSFRSHGSRPPQICSSLPSSFCTVQAIIPPPHLFPLLQPPLLPLPLTKSEIGLPSSSRLKQTNTGMFRSRGRKMKPKPSASSNKEPLSWSRSHEPKEELKKTEEKVTVFNKEEAGADELTEWIYSLSPPPTNLPMPTFLLTRQRATAACCIPDA